MINHGNMEIIQIANFAVVIIFYILSGNNCQAANI